uniref:Helitron helicase-like domain-containing protein n=1 Tax=Ditylenchus dipsaci TaxID=166011 RepID=A0A915EM28_9BILA
MTCNPKWQAILDNLLDGQNAEDRPDMVSNVFELMKDACSMPLLKDQIFVAHQWHHQQKQIQRNRYGVRVSIQQVPMSLRLCLASQHSTIPTAVCTTMTSMSTPISPVKKFIW